MGPKEGPTLQRRFREFKMQTTHDARAHQVPHATLADSLGALWRRQTGTPREWMRALACTWRILLHRERQEELARTDAMFDLVRAADASAALLPFSHRHFLCLELSAKQRVEAALTHFRHEQACFRRAYLRAVYGQQGLALWEETIAHTRYRLILRSNPKLRHEGPVAIGLWVNDVKLCEMSFAWVDAELFGATGHSRVPFITRNQTIGSRHPALAQFRSDHPNHSPAYFCMAALLGIAEVAGCRQIAAIRHDQQISFEQRYKAGFLHSYDDLWAAYGAEPLPRRAMSISVPPRLSDVADLKSKHRRRALNRRAKWAQISESTRDALGPYRLEGLRSPVQLPARVERRNSPLQHCPVASFS